MNQYDNKDFDFQVKIGDKLEIIFDDDIECINVYGCNINDLNLTEAVVINNNSINAIENEKFDIKDADLVVRYVGDNIEYYANARFIMNECRFVSFRFKKEDN